MHWVAVFPTTDLAFCDKLCCNIKFTIFFFNICLIAIKITMQSLLTFNAWMPCWQQLQRKSPTSGRNKVKLEKPDSMSPGSSVYYENSGILDQVPKHLKWHTCKHWEILVKTAWFVPYARFWKTPVSTIKVHILPQVWNNIFARVNVNLELSINEEFVEYGKMVKILEKWKSTCAKGCYRIQRIWTCYWKDFICPSFLAINFLFHN